MQLWLGGPRELLLPRNSTAAVPTQRLQKTPHTILLGQTMAHRASIMTGTNAWEHRKYARWHDCDCLLPREGLLCTIPSSVSPSSRPCRPWDARFFRPIRMGTLQPERSGRHYSTCHTVRRNSTTTCWSPTGDLPWARSASWGIHYEAMLRGSL